MADFQKYTATVNDNESTVYARVSDGDETVQTVTGRRTVNKGEYVVQLDRPDVYDVLTRQEFESTGYSTGGSAAPTTKR